MILTLTPAPALDSTVRLPLLTPGETHRVDAARVRAGGKGINVARVLHAQGLPAHALATRGGANGAALAADVAAAGIAASWVDVAAPTRSSTAWVEDSGRTTVLNERAAALLPGEWDAWFAALGALLPDAAAEARVVSGQHGVDGRHPGGGARVATVSGSWPEGTPPAVVARTVRTLVDAGVYTVADTSGPLLLTAAAAGAHLLKPNAQELAEATGTDDIAAGLARLFELGAGSVLLSRGEDGMSHHTPEDPGGLHARLDEVLVGNPTGAGDAGVAGWLAVAHRHGGIPGEGARREALRMAVAYSASAVLAPLAGELGPDVASFPGRVLFA